EAVQLGELVKRRTHRPMRRRLREAIARALRLPDGVRPGAVELKNLGTSNQALAAIHNPVAVVPTPPRHRRRPLLRPAQIASLGTPSDRAAVDVARNNRRASPCRYGNHHFVKQSHPFGGPAEPDKGSPLSLAGEEHEVHIAEPSADLGDFLEP